MVASLDALANPLVEGVVGIFGMEDASGDEVLADYDAAVGTVIDSVADFELRAIARESRVVEDPL